MENLPLAPMDMVLLLLLVIGAWRGFTKGLVLSVASLVGLVGGIWGASHFSHLVAESLSQHVKWSPNSMHLASLAVTFLAVIIAVHLLAKLLEKLLDLVALGLANKLAGALFGLMKVALILSFLMLLLNQIVGTRAWVPQHEMPSLLLGPIEAIAPTLTPNVQPFMDTVSVSDLEPQVLRNALPPVGIDGP